MGMPVAVAGVGLVVVAIAGTAWGVRTALLEQRAAAQRAALRAAEEAGAADSAAAQPEAQPPAQPVEPRDTPLPRTPGALRLATYNLENLFDSIDDPALSGQYEDIDDAKPEAQLVALAAVIRTLDADVLALQEVESEGALRWFRDTYLADAGYVHLASLDAGDERGIEQAVLSRYPIVRAENWVGRELGGTHPESWGDAENFHAGEPIRFHRSPLLVEIDIPAEGGDASPTGAPDATDAASYRLTLLVVHHKSGGPGDYWREAESAGLVRLLDELSLASPDRNLALLGDFNAGPDAASIRTYLDAGLFETFSPGGVASGRASHTHASERAIDHILAGPGLVPELVAGSGFVLATPVLPREVDYRTAEPPEGYASDHFAVALEVRVGAPAEPNSAGE